MIGRKISILSNKKATPQGSFNYYIILDFHQGICPKHYVGNCHH